MFAPGSGRTSSLRSSRRRQRTSLEDSVKPPAAKRQRSSLRQEPRHPINKAVKPDEERGITTIKDFEIETGAQHERILAIRSSEKTSRATSQTEHTVVLVWHDRVVLDICHIYELTLPASLPTNTTRLHSFHLDQINPERQFLVS